MLAWELCRGRRGQKAAYQKAKDCCCEWGDDVNKSHRSVVFACSRTHRLIVWDKMHAPIVSTTLLFFSSVHITHTPPGAMLAASGSSSHSVSVSNLAPSLPTRQATPPLRALKG